mmetsp:Transcript_18911/g.30655  ORF Transcript_18911/g.30655 Transcript_18911/m.30655 type:complete len:401 (+) Transcript_18911:52-1254(+)
MVSMFSVAPPANFSVASPTGTSSRGALRSSPSGSLCNAGLSILRRDGCACENESGKQPDSGETAGPSQLCMKRGNSAGSILPSSSGIHKLPLPKATSKRALRSRAGLTLMDVEDLFGQVSSAEKANFEKQWFKHDCRRRFEQLCSRDAQSFKIAEMDTQMFLQMFPTLSLDVPLRDRLLRAISTADATMELAVLFDADGDGCIDDQEFSEIMKFCQAWRSTFYNPESASSSSRPATTPSRPPPSPATKPVVRPTPKDEFRRTSGFGARQFISTGDNPTRRPVGRTPSEKSGSRQSSQASKRPRSRQSSVSDRDSSSERLQVKSQTQMDRSRGSFYSCSVDLKQQSLLNEEFLEFLKERKKSGTFSGTIEEMHGHPLRSYTVPSTTFLGDKVEQSSARIAK